MGEVVLEQTEGLFCQFLIQIVQIHACLLSEDKELDRTLPCSILGKSLYGGKTALFPYLFNMGYQNKIIFCNLWNKPLTWGETLIKWGGTNLIFVSSVSLSVSLIFLIIWSTLQYIPWVLFFYVFILLSLTFHVNVIAKKSFLLCFVLAILFSSSCFLKIMICINKHEGSEQ